MKTISCHSGLVRVPSCKVDDDDHSGGDGTSVWVSDHNGGQKTTMEIGNGSSAARVPSMTSTPNSQRAARWPEVGFIEIDRWNDSKLIGNIGMAGGYLLMKYDQP